MRFRIPAMLLAASALLAGGILLFGAVGAGARATTSTTINFRDTSGPANDLEFFGDLTSAKAKCLRQRTVKAFKRVNGQFKLFDTDRSSSHGAWAVVGNLTGFPDVKFKVTRKTVGSTTCGGDTLTLSAKGKRFH